GAIRLQHFVSGAIPELPRFVRSPAKDIAHPNSTRMRAPRGNRICARKIRDLDLGKSTFFGSVPKLSAPVVPPTRYRTGRTKGAGMGSTARDAHRIRHAICLDRCQSQASGIVAELTGRVTAPAIHRTSPKDRA